MSKRQLLHGIKYFDVLLLLKLILTLNVPVRIFSLAPKEFILFYCGHKVKCEIVQTITDLGV